VSELPALSSKGPEVRLGLWTGASHVLRRANAAFLSDCPGFDPVGVPAREAFPDNDDCQDAMDRAYATGKPLIWRRYRADGSVEAECLIEPVTADGRRGLVTAWEWCPATASQGAEAVPASPRPETATA
jgi:hypothetical protein